MDTALQRRALATFAGAAVVVYAFSTLLVQSRFFERDAGSLALGVTLDVAVGVPLLYWLLVARRKAGPLLAMVPLFIAGLVLASFLLPPQHHGTVTALQVLAVPAELAAVTWIGLRVRRIARKTRDRRAATFDFFDALRDAARDVLGRAGGVLATEIGLWYFVCFSWRRSATRRATPALFTYDRGWSAIVLAAVMMVVAETLAVHFLVARWSSGVAWALSALGVYSLVWLTGDWRAIALRPVGLGERALDLRIGMRMNARIPYRLVAGVRRGAPSEPKAPGLLNALVFDKPNVVVELREPVEVELLFGFRRSCTCLALALDEPERFVAELERKLEETVLAPR